MKRSYTEFLQDILDAIIEIDLFVDGVNYESFESNREKTLAVVKFLEIIGEAVKKMNNKTPDFLKKSGVCAKVIRLKSLLLRVISRFPKPVNSNTMSMMLT